MPYACLVVLSRALQAEGALEVLEDMLKLLREDMFGLLKDTLRLLKAVLGRLADALELMNKRFCASSS